MPSTVQHYSTTARSLHWLTALLVVATLPAGGFMVQEGLERSTQDLLFIFHKNVGVVIFLLVIARLAYRSAHPAPPLPAFMPLWQRRAAGVSHFLLYALLLVMTISGYVRVKAGGFPLESLDALGLPSLVPRSDALAETAKTTHFYVRFALLAVIAIHVAAALNHAILKRDGVFSRMWFTERG